MKLLIRENGKLKRISTNKLLIKYNPLIESICTRWIGSFYFDNSLDVDDLCQELRIKLLNNLKDYNSEVSSLATFIKKIAKNFLINKKSHLITDDNIPKVGDKILPIRSIFETTHNNSDNGNSEYKRSFSQSNIQTPMLLRDTIKDYHFENPEFKLTYSQLLERVKKKLDQNKYTPANFLKRKKTFVRKVFDLMYKPSEKFNEAILFDFRCRARKAEGSFESRRPFLVTPTVGAIATYLKVDKRVVNLAFKIIEQTILQTGKQMEQEGIVYVASPKKAAFGNQERTRNPNRNIVKKTKTSQTKNPSVRSRN